MGEAKAVSSLASENAADFARLGETPGVPLGVDELSVGDDVENAA